MKHSLARRLLTILAFAVVAMPSLGADANDEQRWQQVYDAREKFYESHIGKLPDDILKMANLFGVWPGGGLFAIPAARLGKDYRVYSTFGLTNPDMPAMAKLSNSRVDSDGQRVVQAEATLQRGERASASNGAAGYGYELVVLTSTDAQWPLQLLQWAANAEILNDAGILKRVEKYDGLTVEQIGVGDDRSVNVLITKAQPPLPAGAQLPNGSMMLLIATVITDEEMAWSFDHGKPALLRKLQDAGVGQVSSLDRKSVVE